MFEQNFKKFEVELNMIPRSILVVDDEEFIRQNLLRIFKEEHYKVHLVNDGTTALQTVGKENIDICLLDLNLPDMNGLDVLRRVKKEQPDLLVIIITGYASVESAVKAIKLGAYDYIKKPFKADAIKLIVRLAFETISLQKKVQQLKLRQKDVSGLDAILGSSKHLNQVKQQVEEYAKYDYETVLITGESGTGKEMIAQALHSISPRSENEFVEINCASIPETLLESELFGFEKGAFTDAKTSKMGLFERADGGSLFLDEIGEMSLSLQAKLLRVLEKKTFRRLGSTKDKKVDVRIIAATNKNLSSAINRKEFREDLYYRLNVLRINLAPLREREDDIVILANDFLMQFNRKFNKSIESFSPDAMRILKQYPWPGNIRELKNIVERICILQKSSVVGISNLPGELTHNTMKSIKDIVVDPRDNQFHSLPEAIENMESNIIQQVFTITGGNISKAATLLKIPRETLRYKIAKYNIGNGEY